MSEKRDEMEIVGLAKEVNDFIHSVGSGKENKGVSEGNYKSIYIRLFDFVSEHQTSKKLRSDTFSKFQQVVEHCAAIDGVSVEAYLEAVKLEQVLDCGKIADKNSVEFEESLKKSTVTAILSFVISGTEGLPHNTPLLWEEVAKLHEVHNVDAKDLHMDLFRCCRRSVIAHWMENENGCAVPTLSKDLLIELSLRRNASDDLKDSLQKLYESVYAKLPAEQIGQELSEDIENDFIRLKKYKPVELRNSKLNEQFKDIPSLLEVIRSKYQNDTQQTLGYERITDVLLFLILIGICREKSSSTIDSLIKESIEWEQSINALKRILTTWSATSFEFSLIKKAEDNYMLYKESCIAMCRLWLFYLFQNGERYYPDGFESTQEFVEYHSKAFFSRRSRVLRIGEFKGKKGKNGKYSNTLSNYILSDDIVIDVTARENQGFYHWYGHFIKTIELSCHDREVVGGDNLDFCKNLEVVAKPNPQTINCAFDLFSNRLTDFCHGLSTDQGLQKAANGLHKLKDEYLLLTTLLSTENLLSVWDSVFLSLDKRLFVISMLERFLLKYFKGLIGKNESWLKFSKSEINEEFRKQTESEFRKFGAGYSTDPHAKALLSRYNSVKTAISKITSLAENSRYEIGHMLGKGSTGSVFLCKDNVLQRDVAIKMISAISPDGQDAFMLNEAKKLAKLRHNGVIEIYDFLKIKTEELSLSSACTDYEKEYINSIDNIYGLVMEYHPSSSSLRHFVGKELFQLSFNQKVIFFRQILDAVKAVHQYDLIHGDINLDNILVTSEGVPILIDFSASVSPLDATITAGSSVYTSDRFLELPLNQKVLKKSDDVYSLAILLLDLLGCGIGNHFSSSDNVSKSLKTKEKIYEVLFKLKCLQHEWSCHLNLGWIPFVRDDEKSTSISISGESYSVESPKNEFGKYWDFVCNLFKTLNYDESRLNVLLDLLLSALAPSKEKQKTLVTKLDQEIGATIWKREYFRLSVGQLKHSTYQLVEREDSRPFNGVERLEIVTIFGRPLTNKLLREVSSPTSIFEEYKTAFESELKWLPKVKYGVVEKPLYVQGRMINDYDYGLLWEGYGGSVSYQNPFKASSSFSIEINLLWQAVEVFKSMYLEVINWFVSFKESSNLSLPISIFERLINKPVMDKEHSSFNKKSLAEHLSYLNYTEDKYAKPPFLASVDKYVNELAEEIFSTELAGVNEFSKLDQYHQDRCLVEFMRTVEMDESIGDLKRHSSEFIKSKSDEILSSKDNKTSNEIKLLWDFLCTDSGSKYLERIYEFCLKTVSSNDFESFVQELNELKAFTQNSWEFQLYDQYKKVKVVTILEDGVFQ